MQSATQSARNQSGNQTRNQHAISTHWKQRQKSEAKPRSQRSYNPLMMALIKFNGGGSSSFFRASTTTRAKATLKFESTFSYTISKVLTKRATRDTGAVMSTGMQGRSSVAIYVP